MAVCLSLFLSKTGANSDPCLGKCKTEKKKKYPPAPNAIFAPHPPARDCFVAVSFPSLSLCFVTATFKKKCLLANVTLCSFCLMLRMSCRVCFYPPPCFVFFSALWHPSLSIRLETMSSLGEASPHPSSHDFRPPRPCRPSIRPVSVQHMRRSQSQCVR